MLRELAALAGEYGNAPVWVDPHEAETVRARVRAYGARCEVETTGSGRKAEVYKELARHIRGGLVSFPEHPILIAELRRLKVRYGAQNLQIINPRSAGSHGDIAQAFALAVAKADTPAGPLVAVFIQPRPTPFATQYNRRVFGSEFA